VQWSNSTKILQASLACKQNHNYRGGGISLPLGNEIAWQKEAKNGGYCDMQLLDQFLYRS
jgi:hypothetical protein